MNKLEYIPGDIVKIEYGEATGKIGFVTNTFLRRKGFYSLVVSIGKGFQGSSKDDWIQTYNDGVSPIPLTPEVLEKNGWKIEDVNPNDLSNIVSKGIMYRAIKNKEILFFQKGASVFTCPLNWRKIEIKYVHELQHLLFGLGLNSEMEV